MKTITKTYILVVLTTFLFSCAKQSNDQVVEEKWNEIKAKYSALDKACSTIADAIHYPSPWTAEIAKNFVIPDDKIQSMSTCGLVETYITHPSRVLGPWCATCSNLDIQGVTNFNNGLIADKVVVELLARKDCVPVLLAKFISVIEQKQETNGKDQCLEMLLASNRFLSLLTTEECNHLMVMALEMLNNNSNIIESRHIMSEIMKISNYIPFINEAEKSNLNPGGLSGQRNGFSEWIYGYDICSFNIVEKYAKLFVLNN